MQPAAVRWKMAVLGMQLLVTLKCKIAATIKACWEKFMHKGGIQNIHELLYIRKKLAARGLNFHISDGQGAHITRKERRSMGFGACLD